MTCNDTKLILASTWYWGSNAIKLALAPPAIAFNIVLICVLRRCVLLHVNVRYLLVNLSICSLIASGYLLEKGFATLIYYQLDRVCELELSFMTCSIREAIYILFKLPVLGSMLGLGIERVYSTRHVQTYTQNENPRLAIGLLIILWSFAIASVATLLSTAPRDQDIVYCNALFIYDTLAIRILAVTLLPLELLGVSLYVYIWMASVRWSYLDLLPVCLKPRRHQESFALSSRLQRRHNVAITAMMLPSVVFHAVCWTTILGVALAQVHLHQFSVETHLLVSQYSFYAFALAHMTVHPLLCLWNCDMLRWELVKIFPRLQAWFPATFTQAFYSRQQSREADKHFELLTSMWDKHKPSSARSRYGERKRSPNGKERMRLSSRVERIDTSTRPTSSSVNDSASWKEIQRGDVRARMERRELLEARDTRVEVV